MNIAPISDPNTMIPAQAATQNTRRPAMWRSYSGLAARCWRKMNAVPLTTAITIRPSARTRSPGTGRKLMARMAEPTRTADRTPPRLSTDSFVSLTCAGTKRIAMTRATTASGRVTRNTELHSKRSSRKPETSGPSAAMAPPSADHRAIERVRAGPDHRAAMRARVVG